jgi:hypothetical protein
MDFSMKEKERHLGPIGELLKSSIPSECCCTEFLLSADGLRRLTALYRERDSQMQRQGLTPSNALHFDPNIFQPPSQVSQEANGRIASGNAPSPHGSPNKKQQQQQR